MAIVPFDFDLTAGTVHDGELRYVLIRPDVLMGAATKLGTEKFVRAIEESAYLNARESFQAYRAKGLLNEDDFLLRTGEFAARLGWGSWSLHHDACDNLEVVVRNSPFAAGIRQSGVPVCGPISGILRALHLVASDEHVNVTETQCAAQGAKCCRFRITRTHPAPK